MILGLQLLHSHGRVVGFSHEKTFVYPHKAPVKYMCPHISMGLYALACIAADCPGTNSEKHRQDHREENRKWRERNELPEEDDYDL